MNSEQVKAEPKRRVIKRKGGSDIPSIGANISLQWTGISPIWKSGISDLVIFKSDRFHQSKQDAGNVAGTKFKY